MINAVNYILANNPTVSNLVGLNGDASKTKVYPAVAPQSVDEPYIVTRVIGRSRAAKYCQWNWSIQAACYAKSYDAAAEIAEAVITALETQSSGTVNGEEFSFLNLSSETDDFWREHDMYVKTLVFDGI